MKNLLLDSLIPAPEKIIPGEGVLQFSSLHTVSAAPEIQETKRRMIRYGAFFGLPLDDAAPGSGDIDLSVSVGLRADEWIIKISGKGIVAEGGSRQSLDYAVSALAQLFCASAAEGPAAANIPCGEIHDRPRFAWRGFMLDSARHFQNKNMVKRVLHVMAHYRLNVFHWHLTDNQGWRIESDIVPGLSKEARFVNGFYTKSDIREVTALANSLGIKIVPEIDIPGHSRILLENNPQYACDHNNPGSEYCIGNPESIKFARGLFREIMDLFPDSDIIHLGGDEAAVKSWEKCPVCVRAVRERRLAGYRELEHEFMLEISRFVVECGRTPMVWGIGFDLAYQEDTIIQSWLDIREPLKIAGHKNRIVYSVHNSLYLDYPMNLSEPAANWMFPLGSDGIYLADPYVIWEDKVKDFIIGPEACLWTEIVPEWRVMSKILPRIAAYAECAWSQADRKEWFGFLRRKSVLESAGYNEFLSEIDR